MRPHTLSEKILARASGKNEVNCGEVVMANVDLATVHDACGKVLGPFNRLGSEKVWNSDKIVVSLDHWVPATSEDTAEMHKKIRAFVGEQKIRFFYDIGRGGVCHQVVIDEGHVKPGMLVVGSDSHTTTLGAVGAFATGIGVTEMAMVFSTGKIWLRIPENVRIVINGKLRKYVMSKDVILKIIGELGVESAIYKSIEFSGLVIDRMSTSSRMTLCNMSVEMGAKNGIVASCKNESLSSDDCADFQTSHEFDITDLEPCIACPPDLANVVPVSKLAKKNVRLDQVFIGSCTNGRIEDLNIAAQFLKGEKIHKDVRLIVSPASWKIYREAMNTGLLDIFIDSQATVVNPGCSACFGGHTGILAAGETCLSTGNRNFTGRMGNSKSSIYIASPAVAAASAIYGIVTNPEDA